MCLCLLYCEFACSFVGFAGVLPAVIAGLFIVQGVVLVCFVSGMGMLLLLGFGLMNTFRYWFIGSLFAMNKTCFVDGALFVCDCLRLGIALICG